MNKIVAIVGSPKPSKQLSSTYAVTGDFIEELRKSNNDIAAEIIYLNQKNVMPCTGCLACQRVGKCVIDDDMESIVKQMHDADLLIWGSPVHFGFVSSVFQNFVERSLLNLHTFEFLGKPFVNVVTTNGSGEQDVDQYLSKIGYLFGCIKIGSVLKIENDEFNAKKYNAIIEKTSFIIASGKVHPKLVNRLYFSSMKNVIRKNKEYFSTESEIWEKRSWFDKSFHKIYGELAKDK